MQLVDVGGAVVDEIPAPVIQPGLISPLIARQVVDLGGVARTGLGVEGVGVGLEDHLAALALHCVFVGVIAVQPVHMALPHPVEQVVHGGGADVPAVEVSHQGDRLGVGRPDPEGVALSVRVAAHQPPGSGLFAV